MSTGTSFLTNVLNLSVRQSAVASVPLLPRPTQPQAENHPRANPEEELAVSIIEFYNKMCYKAVWLIHDSKQLA
jgi:hypothetical protein